MCSIAPSVGGVSIAWSIVPVKNDVSGCSVAHRRHDHASDIHAEVLLSLLVLHRLSPTKRLRERRLMNPNRKIFEARKRETAALGAGEKLVLWHPLAATIGDSARCMQNLEKVLFTGPKTSDTVTFICD